MSEKPPKNAANDNKQIIEESHDLIVRDPFELTEYADKDGITMKEVMEQIRENYLDFREEMERLGWSNETIGDPQEQLHIELSKYDQADYNEKRNAVLMMVKNYGLDFKEEGDVIIVFSRPFEPFKKETSYEDLRRAREAFGKDTQEPKPANDRS